MNTEDLKEKLTLFLSYMKRILILQLELMLKYLHSTTKKAIMKTTRKIK
jgi:hypothetical protein